MITFITVYFTVHVLCIDRGNCTHWQTPTLSPSFDRIQNTGINLLIQNQYTQGDYPRSILRMGVMSSRLFIHVMKEVSRTCSWRMHAHRLTSSLSSGLSYYIYLEAWLPMHWINWSLQLVLVHMVLWTVFEMSSPYEFSF